MFKHRATKRERIDTGDYTEAEYRTFLREIAFINRYLGDGHALRTSLLREIEGERLKEVSVLDVGCGSGELLRTIADFARERGLKSILAGVDLSPLSAAATQAVSFRYPEVAALQADAFRLPFEDGSFDYAISSLFFHHLTDEQIPQALKEMARVSTRGFFVIDLHRHRAAYILYKLFCSVFRISPLVREDGALSVRRGFKPGELAGLIDSSGLGVAEVKRKAWFRIVARGRETE